MKGVILMDEMSGFGPHLMLDLNDCDPTTLQDLNLIFDILNDLPGQIGMTKIAPPYVFKYEGKVPEDLGITGVVIIAESHLTIHTFQAKNYCFVDMFSCKTFDYEWAKEFMINAFKSKRPESHVVFRGKEFPR
jgi:S-adenosylmethionine decarboxylase